MPRRPRIRADAVEGLLAGLQFASSAACRRAIDAAKAMLWEIEPERLYPTDFVQFRLTGFRPEEGHGGLLYGSALREDLAACIQRLSERAPLREDAVELRELARQWGVSTRTLRRWRSLGLAQEWIAMGRGGEHAGSSGAGASRVGVSGAVAERFSARHAELLRRAARYTRLEPAEREALLRAATEELRAGASPTRAARQAARRSGRGVETARLALRAAGEFPTRRALPARAARLAYRAWRRGVPLAQIARRLRMPSGRVRRAIDRQRHARLVGCADGVPPAEAFTRSDAADVLLSPLAVRLGPAGEARAGRAGPRAPAQALQVAACRFLRLRAAATLATSRAAGALDRAETDLRWAARLRELLLGDAIGAALRRMTHARVPSDPRLARRIASACLETIDLAAAHRGSARLERLAAHRMEQFLAAGRDATLPSGEPAWVQAVMAAQRGRESPGGDPVRRALLSERFGLGCPPSTLAEMAARQRTTPAGISRRIEAAMRRTSAC